MVRRTLVRRNMLLRRRTIIYQMIQRKEDGEKSKTEGTRKPK